MNLTYLHKLSHGAPWVEIFLISKHIFDKKLFIETLLHLVSCWRETQCHASNTTKWILWLKPKSACLCQPNFSLQAVICYLDAKVCTIPMCLKQSASECVSAGLCVYTVCIAARSILQTTYLGWSKMFGQGVYSSLVLFVFLETIFEHI